MTQKPDTQPHAAKSFDCDRFDLFRAAVATGVPSDLSLEWILDRAPRPQFRSEVQS